MIIGLGLVFKFVIARLGAEIVISNIKKRQEFQHRNKSSEILRSFFEKLQQDFKLVLCEPWCKPWFTFVVKLFFLPQRNTKYLTKDTKVMGDA
jgi:hypothetical protein